MQKNGILVMIAFLMCCSCSKADIQYKGILSSNYTTSKPYIFVVGLAGGTSKAMPGEVSLAHNGVLFLDELTEFNRATLEILRQPLEDRKITITRANYTVEYPCSFMLVASMNPCPCGYYGDPLHKCTCTPGQISRYLAKISGHLLDRIDIHCEIQAVPFNELSKMKPREASTSHRDELFRQDSSKKNVSRTTRMFIAMPR